MRTASSALLFSATLAAPAFASGYGATTSYRPEVATHTQPQPSDETPAQVKTELVEASHRVMSTQN